MTRLEGFLTRCFGLRLAFGFVMPPSCLSLAHLDANYQDPSCQPVNPFGVGQDAPPVRISPLGFFLALTTCFAVPMERVERSTPAH